MLQRTITLFFFVTLACFAQPSRKPRSPDWELIACSDFIVRANLSEALRSVEAPSPSRESAWVELPIQVVETVKGSLCQQVLSVLHYTSYGNSSPTIPQIEKYLDSEVTLFLVRPGHSRDRFYFSDDTPAVIRAFEPNEMSRISQEVENQNQIVRLFYETPIVQIPASEAGVRSLLGELTKRGSQELAWQKLLRCKRTDVPAIVRAIGDRRSIPDFDAQVPNSPGLGEAVRHCAPRTIREAASIILEHVTHKRFRRYDAATDSDFQTEMNGWICWCYYNLGVL